VPGKGPPGVESLTIFFSSLAFVALLEIGDKTQLVTISLAARRPWPAVLAGAVLGLLTVTAIGAILGGVLGTALGPWLIWLKAGGGLLFIALGGWAVLEAARRPTATEERPGPTGEMQGALAQAFSFNFLAEFGDKTQIAVIILAATNEAPASVFLGAGIGLSLVALSSVFIGAGLAKVLGEKWLRLISAGLFILAGVLLILEAGGVL